MKKIIPKILRIFFGGKIGYEALLEEHDNKLYYRTLGDDKYGCQVMLDELTNGEYIQVYDTETSTSVTLNDGTICDKQISDSRAIHILTIQMIEDYFTERGLSFEIAEDTNTAFSITFEGHELLPGVASQSDVNRISSVTTSMFRAANNRNYEPRQEEIASSYKINVYDSKFEEASMVALLIELKSGVISSERYFNDDNYKRLLKDIEALTSIKTLNSILIKIGESFDLTLSMSEIHKIKKQTLEIFKTKTFSADISIDNARAFDEKNNSFKIDYLSRTYYAHANQALFNKIYKMKNEKVSVRFNGIYTKDQSIRIDSAIQL